MTLADFLLARIAEDEAEIQRGLDQDLWHAGLERRRRECEAKRRIAEDFTALDSDYRVARLPETEARRFQALVSLAQVAMIYADHPDYKEGWHP